MKTMYAILAVLLVIACFSMTGCATAPPPRPISYLAVKKPVGAIQTKEHAAVNQGFPRGGWYVLNYNFRPAPNVAYYIEEAGRPAGTEILRNADVNLIVPIAFDILLFGYTWATDRVTAAGK